MELLYHWYVVIFYNAATKNSQQSGNAFFGKYEVRIARLDKVMVVNMERVSMVVFLGSMAGSWEGGPWQTTTGKEIQPRGGSWQENVTGKSSNCYLASTTLCEIGHVKN